MQPPRSPLEGWPPASLSQGHIRVALVSLGICVTCGAPFHCSQRGMSSLWVSLSPFFKTCSGMNAAVDTRLAAQRPCSLACPRGSWAYCHRALCAPRLASQHSHPGQEPCLQRAHSPMRCDQRRHVQVAMETRTGCGQEDGPQRVSDDLLKDKRSSEQSRAKRGGQHLFLSNCEAAGTLEMGQPRSTQATAVYLKTSQQNQRKTQSILFAPWLGCPDRAGDCRFVTPVCKHTSPHMELLADSRAGEVWVPRAVSQAK